MSRWTATRSLRDHLPSSKIKDFRVQQDFRRLPCHCSLLGSDWCRNTRHSREGRDSLADTGGYKKLILPAVKLYKNSALRGARYFYEFTAGSMKNFDLRGVEYLYEFLATSMSQDGSVGTARKTIYQSSSTGEPFSRHSSSACLASIPALCAVRARPTPTFRFTSTASRMCRIASW
jgi:hypothetical protein